MAPSWRDHLSQQCLIVAAEVRGHHVKAGAFMRQHAQSAATATRNGYNPLLQDYTNFSLYLGGTLKDPAGQCFALLPGSFSA